MPPAEKSALHKVPDAGPLNVLVQHPRLDNLSTYIRIDLVEDKWRSVRFC